MSDPMPPPVLSRETTIRRNAEGRWFHDDEPVLNDAVARAFDAWVDVADDGRYILRNDVNWAYVEIEGSPIFVERARVTEGYVELSLSDGSVEGLDEGSLAQTGDGNLVCRVRSGRLGASFKRRAMLDLVEFLDEDEAGSYLLLGKRRVHLRFEAEDRS